MVVIPYIQGLSESVGRVLRKHGVSTAMRPYCTLRSMLVHPKDERKETEKCEGVYKMPCLNCDSSYIGETSRMMGTRLKEHRKEVEKKKNKTENLQDKKRKKVKRQYINQHWQNIPTLQTI